MLAKTSRLNSREFTAVFSGGKSVHASLCMLKYTTGHKSTKVAVAVSKKHSLNAVRRNKMRRQVYHMLQRILEQDLPEGLHVVVVIKQEAWSYSFDELEGEIRSLFARVKG